MKVLLLVVLSAAAFAAEKPTGLMDANNRLGFRLFSVLPRSKPPNVFYSPYSLFTAMGMLYAGSKGKTREELYDALNYKSAGIAKENVLHEHKEHTERLLATSNSTVSSANAVVIQEDFKVVPAYVAAVNESFGARVLSVNFKNERQAALETINKWVNHETHGHIKNLMNSPLSPATQMVLMNAVYFKGIWETAFNKSATKNRPFFNDGKKSILVETMSGLFQVHYGEADKLDAEILDLPYRGGQYSMTIILPRAREGIEKLRRASLDSLGSALGKLQRRFVYATLPKFKLQAEYHLKEQFTKLGLRSVFEPRTADLSGIGVARDGNLHVSDVIHKAVIEVDETGSAAAAATIITIDSRSDEKGRVAYFKADHPFVFLICSRDNGVLFAGEVDRL